MNQRNRNERETETETDAYLNPITGEEVNDPSSQGIQEGIFYEKVFGPVKVEIRQQEGKPGSRRYILYDENGETLVVSNRHAQMHLRHFGWLYKGKLMGEFNQLNQQEQSQALSENLADRDEPLKFMYDPASREYVAVTSLKHKQISWKAIREALEGAVKDVYGDTEVQEYDAGAGETVPGVWSFRMPVDNPHVSAWAHVDAGNNMKSGSSAISMGLRLRTEYDTGSGGVRPPCLNWAHLWDTASQWMGIDIERTFDPTRMVVENLEGDPVSPQVLNGLKVYEIHIEGAEVDLEFFEKALRELRQVTENIVIEEYVEKSIREPLTVDEVHDIMDAYAETAQYGKSNRLPAYAHNSVLARFQEEEKTVWGFSQALSWVRTNGDLRGSKPRELKNLTRILGNMAGEILSLAPTIQKIHGKYGDITYTMLTGHPRPHSCIGEHITDDGKTVEDPQMQWTREDRGDTWTESCPICGHEGRTVMDYKEQIDLAQVTVTA